MKNYDYIINDVYDAIEVLGIVRGDLVFIHSNIGFFGRCRGTDTGEEICALFYDAIRHHVGDTGTIVVPAFTYSFPKRETFDPRAPSRMGAFSEYVRRRPGALRSADPCYSIAAIGERAAAITQYCAYNSFETSRSFFARFWQGGGKILNFNFDAGSTFIHYFERLEKVPYRFDKVMMGHSLLAGEDIYHRHEIYVRYLHPDLEAEFTMFDQLARKHAMFRTAKLGRGEMGVITAADTYTLIKETLPARPWFLTKAGLTGEAPSNYTSLR